MSSQNQSIVNYLASLRQRPGQDQKEKKKEANLMILNKSRMVAMAHRTEELVDLAVTSSGPRTHERTMSQIDERNNNHLAARRPPMGLSLKFALISCLLIAGAAAAAVVASGQATSGNKDSKIAIEQSASSSPVEQETLEQQATDLRATTTTNGTQEHLQDMIAFGRIALGSTGGGQTLTPEQSRYELARVSAQAARHSSEPTNGQLVDRIAELELQASGGQQRGHENKLDYIIEFLRQNKLTKFCDLLTQPSGRVRELIKRLDGMAKFTLFVPTNEALLLMPSAQLEALGESADETRQFLMAHATGELVVPRLAEPAIGNSLAQLQSLYSPAGAQNRWSSGRPHERIVQQQQQQQQQKQQQYQSATSAAGLIYSLAGSPLRIVTTPISTVSTGNQSTSGSLAAPQTPTTRLELIVNGANVLSGHSHALQEPNNTSVTYAIVHLIDRTLYPVARMSVYDRIQSVAPKFARLLRASQDSDLIEQLKSTSLLRPLITAFVPNDDAFRTISPKLLDQLESNRTLLQHFVRTHLVEGLFYSGQLASPLTGGRNQSQLAGPQIPRLLTSMSGADLEFEARVLQSRQLILVNSIPILDQDQVALNGVVHSIVRPLFERSQLDDACKCESRLQADNSTADWLREKGIHLNSSPFTGPTTTIDIQGERLGDNNETFDYSLAGGSSSAPGGATGDQLRQQQPTPASRQRLSSTSLSNWFRNVAPSTTTTTTTTTATSQNNQREALVREETRLMNMNSDLPLPVVRQQPSRPADERALRAQRSGDPMLVGRNNRDFYRPTAAPDNMELPDETGSGGDLPQIDRSSQVDGNNSERNNWTNGQRQPTNGGEPSSVSFDSAGLSAFEVERYKVVMNATMRERLRQQQRQNAAEGLIMSSSLQQQQQPASLRQQQQQQQQVAAPTPVPAANDNLFAYDQPLATPPSSSGSGSSHLWSYSASPNLTSGGTASVSVNLNLPQRVVPSSGQQQQQQQPQQDQSLSAAASAPRHQRLLKFQAEDARDSLLGNANQQHAKQQPRRELTGKTVAPPMGNFAGCAFYDAECKRLQMSGKFVRLPPRKTVESNKQVRQQQQVNQTLPSIDLAQAPPANYLLPTTPSSMLDSTFGETTESSLASSASHSSRASTPLSIIRPRPPSGSLLPQPPVGLPKNYLSFSPPGGGGPRVSPLNQPLPPWSEDEHKQQSALHFSNHQVSKSNYLQQQQASGSSNWRAQEVSDLARISHQLAAASSKQQAQQQHQSNFSHTNQQVPQSPVILRSQQQQQQQQQVLLIPVKMFQDSNISLASSRLLMPTTANQSRPIYFAPRPAPVAETPPTRPSGSVTFSANSQYFTPTVQPPSQLQSGQSLNQQQVRPQQPQPQVSLGRLTNFTALETVPLDGFEASSSSGQPQVGSATKQVVTSPRKQFFAQQQQQQQQLKSSAKMPVYETLPVNPASIESAFQQQQQQQQNNSALFQSSIKQARKIVRLQNSPTFDRQQQQQQQLDIASGSGDISVTSAKLSAQPPVFVLANNYSAPSPGGLAVQASNQSPDVSGLAFATRPGEGASSNSADFFQDRTIAEIMDDSGLRIDGQQVTFGRLRDCLDRAGLSSMITQQDNALTIFMPTDMAFQRLVQAQALMQQRNMQRANGGGSQSARLTDRRHLLPLVARVGTNRATGSGDLMSASTSSTGGELSSRLIDVGLSAPSSTDSPSSSLGQRLTLDCSTQQVRQLLLDHLSGSIITPKQLQADSVMSSLSGKRLLLSSVPSKKIVVVDGQPVIAATRAKNGMVYVINKFLNMTQQMPNVIDLLDSQPNLKTFQSYLNFTSLTDRLKRETGPITILAPTNEAFEQLSSAARQMLNSDPAAMMDILRGHVVEGAQFGKLVSMRNKFKTLNSDHFIEAKVMKPNVYQLDSQVTSMRLVGTTGNGVVNSIDRLIVPPWLRISGQAESAPSRATTNNNNNNFGRSILELDDTNNLLPANPAGISASTLSNFASRQPNAVHLPSLNSQVVRFEQPADLAAHLAPPTSSSFSLAGSTSTTTTEPATTVDSFDVPSVGAGDSSRVVPPPAGGRLRQSTGVSGSQLDNFGGPVSRLRPQLAPAGVNTIGGAGNSTKNMNLIVKLADMINARKFIKYLLRSRLSELLKPDMNYVILVPTDQAIERLPRQITEMLERDPDRLSDLVNFHVLDTTFEFINAIPDGQTLNTLNEKDILFNWHRNNTILTASGAVVLGGVQEENIVLLIVDRVLYPTPGDLLSIVTKSPILSNFTQILRNAGLERQLSLAGPFTLFAPSDIAFNQLERRDLQFLQTDREIARRFLLRHLSQPAVFTSSIALSNSTTTTTSGAGGGGALSLGPNNKPGAPQMTITNSLGEDLALRQKNDYFSVNDVNFSYADVAATNGVVHVIDGLL